MHQVYERAIANVPPAAEKRYWQRYIYLWINYALFEELEAQDVDRTREVHRACLKLIPHKAFTFAKVGAISCTTSLLHPPRWAQLHNIPHKAFLIWRGQPGPVGHDKNSEGVSCLHWWQTSPCTAVSNLRSLSCWPDSSLVLICGI